MSAEIFTGLTQANRFPSEGAETNLTR
jgi:hypothetical protein